MARFLAGHLNAAQPRLRGYRSRRRWLSIMADEPDAFRKGLSIAMRIGVELVAALAVGGGLGYLADSYFDSSPTGILIGVFLGMSAGLLNVYRMASRF
ncbi:MAG: AtpZ/AtpI family protein [Nitrospirota bacterium]